MRLALCRASLPAFCCRRWRFGCSARQISGGCLRCIVLMLLVNSVVCCFYPRSNPRSVGGNTKRDAGKSFQLFLRILNRVRYRRHPSLPGIGWRGIEAPLPPRYSSVLKLPSHLANFPEREVLFCRALISRWDPRNRAESPAGYQLSCYWPITS
jgi:hypothetical protein